LKYEFLEKLTQKQCLVYQIERLAYHLHEDEGKLEGGAGEHWLERRNLFTPTLLHRRFFAKARSE
jgi:hypothetical protein